ncbi:hypothetical protein ACSZOK_20485, partial [Aeromonas veronii]|uniref:hypothetical protein n=1 Tax=Aeromonas veronii TaxID=654 RepID=UPI003EC5FB6C
VFRLNRNERSHWSGNGVHVEPESVFMISRNMQLGPKRQVILLAGVVEQQAGLDKGPTGTFGKGPEFVPKASVIERLAFRGNAGGHSASPSRVGEWQK